MAQENVALVRQWFVALAHGELAPELWDPNLTVDNVPEFPITGPYRGHKGLQQWWDDLSEIVDGAVIELDEAEALDDERVLTVQRLVGAFSSTGIPVNAPWVGVFSTGEGMILRVSGYTSREQALEAAGLSE